MVNLFIIILILLNNVSIYYCTILQSTLSIGQCNAQSNPNYVKCPKKKCTQHLDCWESFGIPQRCVCDPILCGSVCLPGN